MSNYITSIHINNLLHLKDFDINICDNKYRKHLILTGPNGAGKTLILGALLRHLEMIVKDKTFHLERIDNIIELRQKLIAEAKQKGDLSSEKIQENLLVNLIKEKKDFTSELIARFDDITQISDRFEKKEFIVAYYGDKRESKFVAVKNPEKPNLSFGVKDNKVDQFVKFLVDLKIQQALAKNEGKYKDAEEITKWFEEFEGTLRELFNDSTIHLAFDYKTYGFTLCEQGKQPYDLSKLSAGYSAVLDIIADLILKMQRFDHVVRAYNVEGIVLIDEIETHLHLALQSQILPLLTKLFPGIQFIITSHSPFILNSIKDATIFDIVHREPVDDLTEYSYEALTEGYFGVSTESGELLRRIEIIDSLVHKPVLNMQEKDELVYLIEDMKRIPDAVAPSLKNRFNELMIEYKLQNQ